MGSASPRSWRRWYWFFLAYRLAVELLLLKHMNYESGVSQPPFPLFDQSAGRTKDEDCSHPAASPGALVVDAIATTDVARLIQEGKPQEAVKILAATIAQGETARLWNDWATAQSLCGDLVQAEAGYVRALALEGSYRQAAVNLGLLLFSLNRIEEATPLLERHKDTLTPKERQAIDEAADFHLRNAQVLPGVVIRSEHFRYISDRPRAMALFKNSVRFVEIEIHSYCNRTCAHCPNTFLDRRSRKIPMEPALYSSIIDDLASIDYSDVIWYSRYNEPTADRPMFLERLREARTKLPNARLQTYTNGDYLTAEYIGALRDAGLNELFIMAYLTKDEEPTSANFLELMVSRLNKLGLPWRLAAPNRAEVDIPGIHVTYNFQDFEKMGTNRGGALSCGNIIDRTSPCAVAITSVYVDFNGSMVPCCDIRSDYEPHKDCVVDVLTPQKSIINAYANSKLVLWRRDLARFGPKKFPCNTCSRGIYPDNPEVQSAFNAISKIADCASL